MSKSSPKCVFHVKYGFFMFFMFFLFFKNFVVFNEEIFFLSNFDYYIRSEGSLQHYCWWGRGPTSNPTTPTTLQGGPPPTTSTREGTDPGGGLYSSRGPLM